MYLVMDHGVVVQDVPLTYTGDVLEYGYGADFIGEERPCVCEGDDFFRSRCSV
jgi:hypothetical protein